MTYKWKIRSSKWVNFWFIKSPVIDMVHWNKFSVVTINKLSCLAQRYGGWIFLLNAFEKFVCVKILLVMILRVSYTSFNVFLHLSNNGLVRWRGAVGSASDSWSLDTCQSWVQAPSNAPVVSLSKKLFSNCLVLVGSRNGFECDLHKQIIACLTNEL